MDNDNYYRTECYKRSLYIRKDAKPEQEDAMINGFLAQLNKEKNKKGKGGTAVFNGTEPAECDQGIETKNLFRIGCVNPDGRGPNRSECVGKTAPSGTKFCSSGGATAIVIFPIPVYSQLSIIAEEDFEETASIMLSDPYGRIVIVLNGVRLYKGQMVSMNTADLKSGIYRLTIQTKEGVESRNVAIKL